MTGSIRGASRPTESSAMPSVSESVERLADAFRSEKRLIDELIAITRRQRAALASEDLQTVGDSAHAIQRVLFTLSEARRRRRAINRMISGTDDLAFGDLEDTLGNSMTEAIRAARDELDGAAMLLSDEVRITRSALRETLA